MKFDKRPVLRHRGSVKMDDAKARVSAQLRLYRERIREQREQRGEAALRDLEKASKAIGSARITKPKPKKK